MAEVEISYKGSAIAQMNASGTKTLLTEAKYLEDDVTITYARPSAPSGTKNISITANGVTTEDVTNYASAQITANVPNTYAAADEGKVVNDGTLVAQTSRNIDTNGTYDTTTNNEVTVNVSGGGVTLAPMDYSVTLTNKRSGNVSFNKIFYNSASLIHAAAANINANASATFNNMLTDGEHIWFCTSNSITNIKYNGENATYSSYNNRNVMLTIPAGFDGTIPFEVYF